LEKAYKFRIEPNQSQRTLIAKSFGCRRYIYNHLLDERKKAYENTGNSPSRYDQSNRIPALKKEFPWLREVDSTLLQATVKDLDDAYNNTFRRLSLGEKPGFPKFKRKYVSRNSYTSKATNNNIEVNAKTVKLPKLGLVKCRVSKQVQGQIVSATVSQAPSGKYFVSVLCKNVETHSFPKTNKSVGIDLGVTTYAATSDNRKFENHKYYRKSLRKLAKAQRSLSRKPIGGSNRDKAKRRVALIHEKIGNQRKDTLHKLSTQLVREYDIIAVETLGIKGMLHEHKAAGRHKVAGYIEDVAWYEFARQLEYKAKWYGKHFVRIDAAYPSSQLCSECGHHEPKLKDLRIRNWVCPKCGARHDRDVNAAVNIHSEGLRLISA
jgi:putative transposase